MVVLADRDGGPWVCDDDLAKAQLLKELGLADAATVTPEAAEKAAAEAAAEAEGRDEFTQADIDHVATARSLTNLLAFNELLKEYKQSDNFKEVTGAVLAANQTKPVIPICNKDPPGGAQARAWRVCFVC
jgi:hypothetical protein